MSELVIESSQRDGQRLVQWLRPHRRLLVAFSGGVDSSLVAAAAARADLELLIAVTADSPSVPRWQLDLAREIASGLKIEHVVIPTAETQRPEYQRNDSRRCFFCKQTLYETIGRWVETRFGETARGVEIASGTNRDDLGDYRPGIQAGREHRVLTPLAELNIGKEQIRQLAQAFDLPNHDLPAAPCLASRIAYGTEVTPERLRKVEQAEGWLRDHGFREFRVRLHADELARIEVSKAELERLWSLQRDGQLARRFREVGFRFVTIDLEGLQSGSMNRSLVSIGPPRHTGTKPDTDSGTDAGTETVTMKETSSRSVAGCPVDEPGRNANEVVS